MQNTLHSLSIKNVFYDKGLRVYGLKASVFSCNDIFLNLAAFCFDSCQLGINCSDQLCVFYNGRR